MADTKYCPRCDKTLSVADFGRSKRRKDGLQGECKKCRNTYAAKWYAKNKDTHGARTALWRAENRKKVEDFLWELFDNNPCPCGESDPVVLDLDHLDPTEKEFAIGEAIGLGISLARVKQEAKKCQVLCANCHRRKTAKENDWWSERRKEKKV